MKIRMVAVVGIFVLMGVVMSMAVAGRPALVSHATDYVAVPITPVVYDGSEVQVGLQQSNGQWATMTVDQRLPCLGRITVDVPHVATVQVRLRGNEPEWQNVPVPFESLRRTFTTRILVVPTDAVIHEAQLNAPTTGRTLLIESNTQWPLALVESPGTTPVRVDMSPATQQIVQIILRLLNISNVDLSNLKGEIPNVYLRWITVGEEGRATCFVPDPEHETPPSTKDSQRVRLIGIGGHHVAPVF